MDYFVFTGSAFFQHISQPVTSCNYEALYNEFSETVFKHCCSCNNQHPILLALIYTKIELQSLCEHRLSRDADERRSYAQKALLLVRYTLDVLKKQVPSRSTSTILSPEENIPARTLRWTGNAVDLVEILYGLDEMRCINNGDIPIGELATFFYDLLGVESKSCYRFFTDIKNRKNENRTYFLDKMQERLNERMRRDDEREMQRR